MRVRQGLIALLSLSCLSRLYRLPRLLRPSPLHHSGRGVSHPAPAGGTGQTAAVTGPQLTGGSIKIGGPRGLEPTSSLDLLLETAGPVTVRPEAHGTLPMSLTGLDPNWDGIRPRGAFVQPGLNRIRIFILIRRLYRPI